MIIRNARVFHDGAFHEEDLETKGGRISRLAPWGELPGEGLDAKGLLLIPGLTDMHVHGALGADLCDGTKEALERFARYEASQGVTQFCAASMSLPAERLEKIFSVPDPEEGALLWGFHMEGPFLSPEKAGCQQREVLLAPDAALYRRLQETARGRIRVITVAPELPGAMAFISELKDDVRLSVGHTAADYETAHLAFQSGAQHVTHLFNAMTPLLQRAPGVAGAAFDQPEVCVELISDGVHIDPAVVRMVFRLFPGRVCLISDSMRAAGLPDGRYEFGGREIQVEGARTCTEDGAIAGSVTPLSDCLRRAVSFGVPLEAALEAATETPAGALGMEAEAGVLKPGRRANFILATETLEWQKIAVNGKFL